MVTKSTRKPVPRRLSEAERKQRAEQRAYTRRIKVVFTNAGFVHLPTGGLERQFGQKMGELDQVFVYENVILVCEDTIEKNPRTHLKNKKILFDEIDSAKPELVDWLLTSFGDRLADFAQYDASRYKIFYLYFSKTDIVLSEADVGLFEPTRVVRPPTLAYLQKMSQNLRRSARTDIFRFLGLTSSDIGSADSGSANKRISTAIIYPNDNTGLRNGVRVVSFMMSADMLLRNSYVLRKDNWEESIELYQRLIERERIQSIRRYLATRQSTFINNIIVSLPPNVEFKNAKGKAVELSEIADFGTHQMFLPDEMNSICVIDGQHRIYAHYEGVDNLEAEIAKLRRKFHLLVTGLIFPPDMSSLEQRKIESELFLDINSNARPIPPDVLLFIETLKDPFSDLGVARQVLAKLNSQPPFQNKFQLSVMDEGKIKIASIIKFALRYLVEIKDDPAKLTLFAHWATADDRAQLIKDKAEKKNTDRLEMYIQFVVAVLTQYFNAVKAKYPQEWQDSDSRLLSTTPMNGFIIALRRSLPSHGVLAFEEYQGRLKNLKTNFSKASFPFTSSQYAKYSKEILANVFDIRDEPK